MERDIKLIKIMFWALAISSGSMIFAIFSDYEGSAFSIAISYIGSILFWLSMLVGYIIFYVISKDRKEYEKIHGLNRNRNKKTDRPGALRFFSNKYAKVADITMIVSFVITLVFMFIPSLNQDIAVVIIAILVFSVHMHCILNGVNFKYINSIINKGE